MCGFSEKRCAENIPLTEQGQYNYFSGERPVKPVLRKFLARSVLERRDFLPALTARSRFLVALIVTMMFCGFVSGSVHAQGVGTGEKVVLGLPVPALSMLPIFIAQDTGRGATGDEDQIGRGWPKGAGPGKPVTSDQMLAS